MTVYRKNVNSGEFCPNQETQLGYIVTNGLFWTISGNKKIGIS